MYVDGVLCIDLTEAFGAGYEPNQSWCNNNIPYFTGELSINYTTSKSYAREIVGIWEGVNGVAVQRYP